MRPDQHKRRKNAIYKKAHGIVSTKNAKNKETTPQNITVPIVPVIANTANKKSCDEEDDEEKIAQHFSRRKIENNWEKYDKDPNERKEGDEEDESEDDSAYNLEMSLKSKLQLEPPSWREVGHIIYVPEEEVPFAKSAKDSTDPDASTGVTSTCEKLEINTETHEIKDEMDREECLFKDLDLLTKDVKPVVNSLSGKKAKKSSKCLADLEKDLDDLLTL